MYVQDMKMQHQKLNEELSEEEKEMMLEFPGYIMPRSEYERFIEEWEKDCEEERQLHRSFPY